jgi:hypothetical protein
MDQIETKLKRSSWHYGKFYIRNKNYAFFLFCMFSMEKKVKCIFLVGQNKAKFSYCNAGGACIIESVEIFVAIDSSKIDVFVRISLCDITKRENVNFHEFCLHGKLLCKLLVLSCQ